MSKGRVKKDDFTRHLEERLKDPKWAKGYYEELENTEIALRIAYLREKKHLTQAQLAKKVGTSQPAIARLEALNYEGTSVRTLRRVAEALDTKLVVSFEPKRRFKVRTI